MDKRNDNTTPHASSDYDRQIHRTIPYYDSFHTETIHLVAAYNPTPKTWLDTGCGTGLLIEKCLQHFPATAFVLADPSQAMLNVAIEKFSDQSRVSFLEAVASENLPLDIGCQPDVITAIQSHHYLSEENRAKATAACYRLLIADGIYVTFENVAPMSPCGTEIAKRNWGNYQLSMGKTPEQIEAHLSRYGSEYFPITVEKHLTLYKKCGFKTVELFWYSYMQAGFYCIK